MKTLQQALVEAASSIAAVDTLAPDNRITGVAISDNGEVQVMITTPKGNMVDTYRYDDSTHTVEWVRLQRVEDELVDQLLSALEA